MTTVRVVALAERRYATNPLSGHSWPVYGNVTGYEVRGPFGRISVHRSEHAAERACREWQEWYDAHPINQ